MPGIICIQYSYCTSIFPLFSAIIHIRVLCIIEQSKLNLTNKDLRSLGSDYESIHEAEIDASPSAATATIVETAATNEDAFDGYSALTNRVVTVHEPPAYCALEVSRSQVVVLPDEAFKTNPIYVNIVQR